ncbi:hypothetical protein ACS0TY_008674 [Phlomoides rotata]
MSSAPWASTVLHKTQTPAILSPQSTSLLSLSTSRNIRFPHFAPASFLKPLNFSSLSLYGTISRSQPEEYEEDEEPAIGDCLVYEEGIFNDPVLENTQNSGLDDAQVTRHPNTKVPDVSPENLIPDGWLDVQKELNITKKERRKLAQQLEFGRSVEKRRLASLPLDSVEFEELKKEKLKQLNPVVLDSPKKAYFRENDKNEKRDNEVSREVVHSRVAPRNPRLAVYGGGLEDVSALFDSERYDQGAAEKSQGKRQLFTKEEKTLTNRRVPNLAVATSGKWHPLHTLAASGEFYLATSLLKHNLDINAPDKNGLTAIHKSILAKKQAIFNFLLRESANPFVRDSEGATLLHYAVYAASSQMIKILLLYNVDLNLQDNDGWTPLHLALQSRRTDIVRLLLIKGADRTLKNQDGLTALDLCLYSGRDVRTYELIKLLTRIQ